MERVCKLQERSWICCTNHLLFDQQAFSRTRSNKAQVIRECVSLWTSGRIESITSPTACATKRSCHLTHTQYPFGDHPGSLVFNRSFVITITCLVQYQHLATCHVIHFSCKQIGKQQSKAIFVDQSCIRGV